MGDGPRPYTVYGASRIGEGTHIGAGSIIGHPGKHDQDLLRREDFDSLPGATIGDHCTIRSHSIIYSGARLADHVQTGHRALVREDTVVGPRTLVGTDTVIEDQCRIGSGVSLQTGVYIPTFCVIEDHVFIGPRAVLTNDKRMGRGDVELRGVHVGRGARVGANCTILPGIRIGRDAVVGAGAVVTRDVPERSVVVGSPARVLRVLSPEEAME